MNNVISNEGREQTNRTYQIATDKCIENAHPIIQEYASYLSNWQKSTITRYTNIAADFMDFLMSETGKSDIYEIFTDRKVNPIIVARYIKTPRKKGVKEISNNTYLLRKNMLRKFFDFLILDNVIEKNFCDYIDSVRPVPKNKKDRLTDREVGILISNIRNPERLDCGWKKIENLKEMSEMWEILVKLAIMTGARFAELANLTYSAIDKDRKIVTYIQKGGRERTDALSDEMVTRLKDYQPKAYKKLQEIKAKWQSGELKQPKGAENMPDNQIFFTLTGNRLDDKQVNRTLKTLSQGIDKNVTCHTLRHTCASKAIEEVDIIGAKEILGHKSIMTTQIYIHPDEQKKYQAADYIQKAFDQIELDSNELSNNQRWK